jgi:hypothetical protein
MTKKIITSDLDEFGFALGKAKNYSHKIDKLIYIFRDNGFYWMTDEYKPSKERDAIVYPGGRIELSMKSTPAGGESPAQEE